MRTTFACTACGATIAADIPVGGRVRCPMCHAVVIVPEPPCVLSGTSTPPTPTDSSTTATSQFAGGATARPAPPAQGAAIGSLVCGIIGMLGCAIPVGLVGLILGIVSTVRASRDPHVCGGKGMAISGIVLGGLSIALWPFLWVALFNAAYEPFAQGLCQEQLKSIHRAMMTYGISSAGKFPEQEQGWEHRLAATGFVTVDEFWCIKDEVTTNGVSYFYVPGYDMRSAPSQIIVYEHPDIHENGGHILRIDGTIEFLDKTTLLDLLSELKLPDGTPWAPHMRP